MQRSKLVLVGNGMAGIRTVEELLKLAPERYDITVIGAEPHPNYNRILLSPVLAGEQTLEDIVLNDWAWYQDNGIQLHAGCTVTEVDRQRRVVRGVNVAGQHLSVPYDRLVLATGSSPFMLPIPGKELQGVLGYRDIADTQAMLAAASQYQDAVVIGGGLLGLEAANGLMKRGMRVTVVHACEWLMERQLDPVAGHMLQQSLAARGMQFVMQAQTQELLGDASHGPSGRVRAVRLKNGSELPAQLVVMAVGIRPNTQLAQSMRLHVDRGIVVSDTLQTVTDPRIYAVGECAAHRGVAYGLVAPLFEQGRVAANHLAEWGIGRYAGSQTSTKLKVTGIDLFSAGNFQGGEGMEEIVLRDPYAAGGGVYKKLVIQNDKLVGACLYGDTTDGSWYFKLLREGRSVADIRDRLMLGESLALGSATASGDAVTSKAAAMQDSDEVCGCNGVSKGRICQAIRDKGLLTLDAVRKHTKASASCGACTGVVEQLIALTAGSQAAAAVQGPKPLCTCTAHGHQAVRDAIIQQRLLSMDSVFRALEWRTAHGCAVCRPAVNYYLTSTWPQEARDDPQSRFINERSHANIQKDGTYSVIPRMWGGETTAAELRRIADVVDKYQIPTVKVTGGQRIDLLGVKKEDLQAVWQDIGMPCGHAYAKALRTVKTCVGSEWCRMGTQDSTQLGKDLERAFFGMYAPHKVKFAVSGCPRNCAESGIKDVGIVGVDSGWEMYIAGNGGIKTEVAHFFTKLKTAEEVMEHTGAFMQLYRLEGWYLERTVHYVARVGLEYVKQRILQGAPGRQALWAQLQAVLDDAPDPWLEQDKAGVDGRQFRAIPFALQPSVPA